MAHQNQVFKIRNKPYVQFKFIREIKPEQMSSVVMMDVERLLDPKNDNDDIIGRSDSELLDKLCREEDYNYILNELIAEKSYKTNVIRMTIMWTATSFGNYLLLYLNKYLSGTIFINYYFEGVSGIIGYIIGKVLYSCF